jgi:zinc protease
MKKLLFLIALPVVLAGSLCAKIVLPKAEEFKLDNGMTVTVIQRPQLPLISLKLTFRAGSIFDPIGKEGLASLASDMLMRGTSSRSAKQIADEVAFGGGTLENSCNYVSAGLEGEFLTAQGEKAFDILADLVRNSTFAVEEFDKTRTRTLGGLRSRLENPANVAGDAIWSTILGSSRYAHFTGGTGPTVKGLTRDDIVQFVKNRYTPDNSILVVCGDVTPQAVRKWMAKYFGQWTGKAASEAEEASFPPVAGRQVIIYDKKDATQTQIRLGLNGMRLNHPDFSSLEVARTVYGGSFTSRLMDEIRVNRGLTYGVSYRSSNLKPGGVAFVTTFTRNATVGEVVDIILAEAVRMQTEPVGDSDLIHFTSYRCGTYPLTFETNDDLAGVFANLWLNNLDKSYYQDYQEKLRAVTPVQVKDAAIKYFPKDNYRLILVGKADEIMEQAKRFGPVTVVPFSQE